MATALPADLNPMRPHHPSVLIQARPKPGPSSPTQLFSSSINAFDSNKQNYAKRASLSAISSMKGVVTGRMQYKRSREDTMAELEGGDSNGPGNVTKKQGRPRLSHHELEDEDGDGPRKKTKTRGRPRLPQNRPVVEDSEPEEIHERESTASRKVQIQIQIQKSRSAAQPIVLDSDSDTVDFNDDDHLPQDDNGIPPRVAARPVGLEGDLEAMDWCSDVAPPSQISGSGLRRSRSISNTIQAEDAMDNEYEIKSKTGQVAHKMPQLSSSIAAVVNGATESAETHDHPRVLAQRDESLFSTFRTALLNSSTMPADSIDANSRMVEQPAHFLGVLVGDIA